MAEKYYHNDYKKLIGIDESRTASEKLLDRAMRQKQPISFSAKVTPEAKKKVKKEQVEEEAKEPGDVVRKIMKVLSGQNQSTRILKAMGILKRCLEQQNFLQKIDNTLRKQLVECLFQVDESVKCQLGDAMKVSQATIELLQLILEAEKKQTLMASQIEDKILYLKLITDDSFLFNKSLLSLKQRIFQKFEAQKNESAENELIPAEKEEIYFLEQKILRKIFYLPNIGLEWVRASIISFLKEFTNQYKQLLRDPRWYLKEYNKLLQEKKNTSEEGSYDIMGKPGAKSGGSFTVLEQQDSTGTWCKKQ